MTEHPTFATFEADPTDDSEFSGAGEVVTPGGRGLSEALTQALERQGFKVPRWDQHEFYGWKATVELNGQKCRLLLQGGEPWLLIAEERNGLVGWMRSTEERFRQLLTTIDVALKSDGRFKDVLWFTRAEYEKGNQLGSVHP